MTVLFLEADEISSSEYVMVLEIGINLQLLLVAAAMVRRCRSLVIARWVKRFGNSAGHRRSKLNLK